MGSLASLILALTGSVAARVLTSLGIGLVTYIGLDQLAGAVTSQVQASYGSMPASVIQFLGLAGVGQAIGILLGALTARVAMVATKRYRVVS